MADPDDTTLGAYGIEINEDDPENSRIFVKSGYTPTEREVELVLYVTHVINRNKKLIGSADTRNEYAYEILNAFSVGAVQASQPEQATRLVDNIVRRLCQDELFPQINTLINKSVQLLIPYGVLATIVASVSVSFSQYLALAFAAPFALFTIGLLAGRYISLFMLKSEDISSLDDFERLSARVRSPHHGAWLDIVISFCAVILFGSGLLNIAIGQVSTNVFVPQFKDGVLSTQVAQTWMVAVGFGILIGIARSNFVTRLVNFSRRATTE